MSSLRRRSIGGFTLETRLGGGGQGSVYRARSKDGEFVALKLLPLEFDNELAEEMRCRVRREFDALNRVRDPGIVRVLEEGETGDYLYVAFELIDGENLDTALSAPMPPAVDDCLLLLEGIAPGLDMVHGADLIHRDLKPSNIVLRGGSWSSPVIVDFGYAKEREASTLTVTGLAVGTPQYMAPEVFVKPSACSPRSDQFSLARVVTEALTVAFGLDLSDFSNHNEMLEILDSEAPSSCATLATGLSPTPADRFSSITEFARSFRDSMLDDQLITVPSDASRSAPRWTVGESLRDYFERIGCEIAADKRPHGCLWILGDYELLNSVREHLMEHGIQFSFAQHGGKASRHRPAWYTKSPR